MWHSCQVSPSDILYRWLHPSQFNWKENRPTSGAFTDPNMSVDIAKLTTIDESYIRAKKNNKNAVVSFEANEVLSRNQEIHHCPTNILRETEESICLARRECSIYKEDISSESLQCINPAHACVLGHKTRAFSKNLRSLSNVEIYPPQPFDELS
jgi:hypothetical protein